MIEKQQEEVGKKEKPTQQAEKLSEIIDLTSSLTSQAEQEKKDAIDEKNPESFSQLRDLEYPSKRYKSEVNQES